MMSKTANKLQVGTPLSLLAMSMQNGACGAFTMKEAVFRSTRMMMIFVIMIMMIMILTLMAYKGLGGGFWQRAVVHRQHGYW